MILKTANAFARRGGRYTSVVIVVQWLLACSAGGPEHCELGQEHPVARVHAKDFDAIELVRTAAGPLALWSEPSGAYARPLHAEGRPRAAVVRLGPRCEGGLAAVADGRDLELACIVHGSRHKPGDPGGLLSRRFTSALELTRQRWLGEAGPLSEGVSVARGAKGIEVAWHDGSQEAHRVFWTVLDRPEARVISEPGRMAFAPALAAGAAGSAVVWAENWVEGEQLRSHIAFVTDGGKTRSVVRVSHTSAMPRLLAISEGFVLGYRDRARESDKPGLHALRLRPDGEPLGEPNRIGRADGVGRPALCACMGGIVTATPRTYGGDYFVGINWLFPNLERLRGEQQFYEDSRAFTQVAATCLGSHALLLVAEFPQLQRDTTALRAVPYRCR